MSFLGAIGVGLGSAISGLASGVLNNYYNKKAQSAQNAVQWQFWNANNDYNSPASVMQRLEEAGLNPNLVYQNGGASYQATMPTAAKRASADFNFSGFSPLTFQQLENMEAQNDLLKDQASNAKAQGRILAANARIAEKDAQIYEDTGVRPGDSPTKSLWRMFNDWFTFDDSSRVGNAINETREEIRRVNADKYPPHSYSKKNSSNVKFYG